MTMSPSPPYRHLLEAPLGSPTPTWIAHLIVGRACAESPSNPKNAMKRIAFEVGFMPWNTPAVTRGQGRSSIMGAVAMLFLMIVTTPSALAEHLTGRRRRLSRAAD